MRPEIAKINETRFVESLRLWMGEKKKNNSLSLLGFRDCDVGIHPRFFFNFKSDLTQREVGDVLRRSGTQPQLMGLRKNGRRARSFILKVSMSGRSER